jgi:hypothetical protein
MMKGQVGGFWALSSFLNPQKINTVIYLWARSNFKAGKQYFYLKSALETSCRTKLIALVNIIVHDRTVARLEALEQAVWKY